MRKLLPLLLAFSGIIPAQVGNTTNPFQGYMYPVDSSTGVTQNYYVKWDSTGAGVLVGATTDGAKLFAGIAQKTAAANSGLVLVTTFGPVQAVFDGSITQGDSWTTSTTSNGQLHDTGVAFSSSNCATGSLGIINSPTTSGGGTYNVTIQPCIGAGTVASGTLALGTTSVGSGACDASALTAVATGALTTDSAIANFNADPTSTTGYAPSTNGGLFLYVYITANTLNVKRCNNTSASITPAAATLQWRVIR
jgi:hypothetical protein